MCANDSEDSWRRLTEENRDEADPAGVKVLAPHIVLSVDFRFVTQGPRGDRTSINAVPTLQSFSVEKSKHDQTFNILPFLVNQHIFLRTQLSAPWLQGQ